MEKQLSKRVFELREKMGLTQRDFANICDLTITALSRIEHGEAIPQKGTLDRIILKTGVNETWLRTGKGELTINKPEEKIQQVEGIWKEEAYARLREELAYMRQNYDKVLSALLGGGKLGGLRTPDKAGLNQINKIRLSRVKAN